MPDWVFDTSALIDYYRDLPGVRPYFDAVLERRMSAGFSTISEAELWQGLKPGEEERHEAVLALLERVPVDSAIARKAGGLRKQVGLANLTLPDAIIAATAAVLVAKLVTRNTKHFAAIEHLVMCEFYSK
jgi:predicted nucleic acid-binding protein